MSLKQNPTLTTIHYFDFHRNIRKTFFSIEHQASIGTHPLCNIQIPSPSLFRGVIQFVNQTIFRYASVKAFDQHKPIEKKILPSNAQPFRFEIPGLLISLQQSTTPFETLIDHLIEEFSTASNSKQIQKDMEMILPKEILALWPLEKIWPVFSQHRKGYGDIEHYMNSSEVTEILINGTESVYVETAGSFHRAKFSLSPLRLERLMTKLLQKTSRSLNIKHPIVDFQLPSGERVNMILPPVSKKGAMISIRKFRKDIISLEQFASKSRLSSQTIDLLKNLVATQKNILVSGGTGSGKTTLLNALLGECDPRERIIIVEDSSELHPNHPHWINLEARPPNHDPSTEIPLSTLVRNTLRMRPTRVICGECRGPEAFQMLMAMNSGHPGSMTTLHANSPLEALFKLEIFLLMAKMNVSHHALRQFIASSIHVVIQLTEVKEGRRNISEISKIGFNLDTHQYQLKTLCSSS